MACRFFELFFVLHVWKIQPPRANARSRTLDLSARHVCYRAGQPERADTRRLPRVIVVMLVLSLPIDLFPRDLVRSSFCVASRTGWRYLRHQELLRPRRPRRSAALPLSTSPFVSKTLTLCLRRVAPLVPIYLLLLRSCHAATETASLHRPLHYSDFTTSLLDPAK